MAYLARAQYYIDSEKAYKKAINDLRSALTYLKYWDGAPDSSKAVIAQKAESNLNSLKASYAPLKTADLIKMEAQNLRGKGSLQPLFMNSGNYSIKQTIKKCLFNIIRYL